MGFVMDLGNTETWQPSVRLRFVSRPSQRGESKVLQQLHVSSEGKLEWRDIEIVKEE